MTAVAFTIKQDATLRHKPLQRNGLHKSRQYQPLYFSGSVYVRNMCRNVPLVVPVLTNREGSCTSLSRRLPERRADESRLLHTGHLNGVHVGRAVHVGAKDDPLVVGRERDVRL